MLVRMRASWWLVGLALVGGCRLGFDPMERPDAVDCAVTISPNPARVNFNSRLTFSADGGEPGYQFAIVTDGKASIEAATGELTAGAHAGTATVEVKDAAGCRASVDVVIGGDTLWFAGGSTAAVPSREIWRSTNGIDWTLAGLLPLRRTNGVLVSFRDQLLYIAGSDATPVATVFASPDGITWSLIGSLPEPASSFGFAIHRGLMFVVGGNGNADNVFSSSDGVTWTTAGHLPDPNHGGSLVSFEDRLWYVGGHNGTLYDWVLASSDGSIWTRKGSIPLAREYHAALIRDGAMWIIGGQDTMPTKLSDVSTTTNGADWTSITSLPMGRAFGPIATFAGRLWSLGGNDLGGVWSTTGTAWTVDSTTFPAPRQGGATAVFTPR